MKDILISVVVPVYNAQRYIASCVESILKQTHTKLELLLIVDGATDRSLEICEQLRLQDSRITVVDKENEGVSATRNRGIEMAKGEYIAFIDADDTVAVDYLEVLLDALLSRDAQIALCQYAFVREEGLVSSGEPVMKDYCRDTDSLYDAYIRPLYRIDGADYIMGSACRSLFERKLLTDNNLRFPACKLNEDQLFLLSAMACSRRIAAVNRVMYYYNDLVTDSALRKPYKKNLLEDQQNYLFHLEQRLPGLPITRQQQDTVRDYCYLITQKLLKTNAAMHPDNRERDEELKRIRRSKVCAHRVKLTRYVKWLLSQPKKTIVAEILLRLGMYGLLRKLRRA